MADTKTFTSPIEETTARGDTANQSGQEGLAALAPLTIPDTNMVEVVNVQAGVELPLAFNLDDAQIEIVEADLHLNFANGSTIVLEGFAELSSMENPPAIVMEDGTVLPADAVLLPYLDADSAPAAGPTVSSGGVGTYRDDLGQVIEGVDRLGTQDPSSLTSSDGTELDDQSLLLDEQGPPDAVDDMATTNEDTAVVIPVLANDSDPDGDPLEIVSFTQPEIGTVTQNPDGTFTYDPDGQFEGLPVGETATETFTYTISDGQGGSDTAMVTVTITGANDPPDALNDLATTDEDTAVVIPVLPNDSDPDGDPLEIVSFTQPGKGTVTQNPDGTFTYDPAGQFEGLAVGETATETFEYTITDNQSGLDTATVTVTINGINDPPVIELEASDSVAAVSDEGLPDAIPDTTGSDDTTNLDTDSGQIVFTDVDITDTHTVTLTAPSESLSSGGTELVWTGGGTGTLVGTAGQGGSLVITISIDNNGNYTVDQDAPIDHPLADVEDDLSFDVGVTVTDDSGAVNNSATAAITVTVEDDSPTVGDTSLGTQAEDSVANLNVFDIPGTEGGADGATLTDVTIDQGEGSVVFDANGDVTFSPTSGYAGPVSLSYTITDADNDSAQGTIDLTMPSDSVPTVNGGGGTVYEAGLIPDGSDAGGVAISASGLFNIDTGNDSFGGLYIDGVHADPGATFVSANDYGTLTITESGGQWGWVYSFTVTVLDHEGTTSAAQSIDITIVDDVPSVDIVAAAADSTPTTDSVVEDGAALNGTWTSEYGADTDGNNAATVPATIKVTVDGGTTTYDLDTAINTGYGTLMVNSDATWSFDPVPVVQPRDVDFTVTITDADGDVRSDTHTITITDGSDPGDAADVNLTVAEAGLPTPVTDSDTIDFTPGADDLTSMVFSGAVGTISGDYADAAI
ncbi:MAG: tandem-95 repeat protein, partial [Deltaproteobacteria bacterium]|nr:tandem-95 repeat protein [Deltaproteobacteria bacterium]